MKKCILILPYFGKFKNYFNLFLKSCKYNPSYNWLIITDNNEKYDYPDNVEKVCMSFQEFRSLIQSKFDFDISLKSPYKLCDFKPAYGYICESWIEGYDYWGHCDCDLLFGNLDKYLNPLLNKGYDKIFAAGHLTIYRNDNANNRRFMHAYGNIGELYRYAFSDVNIFAFDEMCYAINVHKIFESEGCNIYTKDLAFNVSTDSYVFRRKCFDEATGNWFEDKKSNLLYWKNGNVISLRRRGGNIENTEYLYIHLQMRKMNMEIGIGDAEIIKISPSGFEGKEKIISSINEWKHEYIHYINSASIALKLKNIKRLLPGMRLDPIKVNPYREYLRL